MTQTFTAIARECEVPDDESQISYQAIIDYGKGSKKVALIKTSQETIFENVLSECK